MTIHLKGQICEAGQNVGTRVGDGDGVLELRREGTIHRDSGPFIVEDADIGHPGIYHRFYREHDSWLQCPANSPLSSST